VSPPMLENESVPPRKQAHWWTGAMRRSTPDQHHEQNADDAEVSISLVSATSSKPDAQNFTATSD